MLAAVRDDARCDCGSRAPDVTADPVSGRPASVALHVGEQTEHVTLGDYRRVGALLVPFAIANTSANGTWTVRVRGAETLPAMAPNAFAPPPAPHDATLAGTTSVAMAGGLPVPVLPVTVNGGPPLHFLLDTGGQNAITPAAAERAGMHVVGAGTVGGAGAGLANVQFGTARTLRIGGAELRDQPFIVVDLPGSRLDGVVGYELLARFAARIDFANETVELAPDARAFAGSGIVVPMTFDDRQPQVDGALDGIPGAVTIDTGSASAADVNTPFVRAHDLVAHYHATVSGSPIVGLGGPVRAYFARADELRLGELRVRDVPLLLTEADAGAEANPTVAVNLGGRILRRYTLVLDYRGGTIRFDPPSRR
jgi:predicted aspartyl protease